MLIGKLFPSTTPVASCRVCWGVCACLECAKGSYEVLFFFFTC